MIKDCKRPKSVFIKSTWSEENDAIKLQPVLCYFCCKRVNLKRRKRHQVCKYMTNEYATECYKHICLKLTSFGLKYLWKRTIKSCFSSLLQFKMAACIRMINEFPPKFAHHVTLLTATKALCRRASYASRPFFPPRKILPRLYPTGSNLRRKGGELSEGRRDLYKTPLRPTSLAYRLALIQHGYV